jgi:hypothetical protein
MSIGGDFGKGVFGSCETASPGWTELALHPSPATARLPRLRRHLRSPRTLDSRASLRSSAPRSLRSRGACGAYVVVLRRACSPFDSTRSMDCSTGAVALPFPGSRWLARPRCATRSRPAGGWSTSRFHEKEARSRHPRGGRERSERAGAPQRERGEVWGPRGPLEPPRANAR